jgi:hypothetical protein
MYERSPQKSPQMTILNLRSCVLTDSPNALGACAEKRLQGFEMGW